MVEKDLRAAVRTDVEGVASAVDSKSEIEFTKGIAGLMIRCGNVLPKASTKYCAALIAKALVGHALGQANAFGIAASDCATVSRGYHTICPKSYAKRKIERFHRLSQTFVCA